MNNQSERERTKVIKEFEVYFNESIKDKSCSLYKEVVRIYRIAQKEDVKLECFCSPKRCHGDIIKEFLDSQLNKP